MTTIPSPSDRPIKPVFGDDSTRLTLIGDRITIARQSKRSQQRHGGQTEVTFSVFDLMGIAYQKSGKMIGPGRITFLFAHDPAEKWIEHDQARLRADSFTVTFTPVFGKRVDQIAARLVQLNPRIRVAPSDQVTDTDRTGAELSGSSAEESRLEEPMVDLQPSSSDAQNTTNSSDFDESATEGRISGAVPPDAPPVVIRTELAVDSEPDRESSDLTHELERFANLLANYVRARSAAENTSTTAPSTASSVDLIARTLAAAARQRQKGFARMERKYTEEIRAALIELEHSLRQEYSVTKVKGQVLEIDGDQVTISKQVRVSKTAFEPSEYSFHILELTDVEIGKLKPASKWDRFGEDEYLRLVVGPKKPHAQNSEFLQSDPTTIFFGDARQHPEVAALLYLLAEYFASRLHGPGTSDGDAATPRTTMSHPIEAAFPQEDVAEIRPPVEIADELRKLGELRNADVLSEEEFLRQKRRLLSL